MSKIAFLLLTYDEHNKYKDIENFLKNGNIYVHAKFPNNVKSYLKDYIIKEYIKTEWGGFGLVKASIKLLESAIQNKDNKWFVLMSNSCYPILTYNKLYDEINKNNNKYSFFSFIKIEDDFYKTSQFWILNREDAITIINTQKKYFQLYQHKRIMDEKYFLTVLMKENKNYMYNNKTVTFARWIENIDSLHPIIFNKVTPYDTKILKDNNYFFIRKVTDKFTLNSIIPKENLIYVYIDTLNHTNNDEIKKIIDDEKSDIIIFYSSYGYDLIPPKLKNKSIYLINVHYILFNEYYNLFLDQYKNLLSQWKNTKFISF